VIATTAAWSIPLPSVALNNANLSSSVCHSETSSERLPEKNFRPHQNLTLAGFWTELSEEQSQWQL
jgi:hypothetical protein